MERNKELVSKCEEDRARLKTLSEGIGTYIDGVDDHLTGQSAREGHSVNFGAFQFTQKKASPALPAEKQGSPGGGGKRRKKTLRKKIIRRK